MAAEALLMVRPVQNCEVLPRHSLPALGACLPGDAVRALIAAVNLAVHLNIIGVDGLVALGAEKAANMPVLLEGDDVIAFDKLLAFGAENVGLLNVVVALITVNFAFNSEEFCHGFMTFTAYKAFFVIKIALDVKIGPFKLFRADTAFGLGWLG